MKLSPSINSGKVNDGQNTQSFPTRAGGISWILLMGLLFTLPILADDSSDDKSSKCNKEDSAWQEADDHDRQGKDPKSSQRCYDNTQCSVDAYCEKPMGQCDGLGICEVRPEVCITLYDPVCGCDGHTYSNACVAASSGVSVDYMGECDDPGILME